ncbi:MAG: hypothetical protein KZQ63_09815 [Candidatus Thiodiazotropha sp. (ex Lucinoma aequizonata)]|nr:hypothetical protein [Candidatus Thiodiazotropha sp. (ex Lucinoma aequizonata)]
MIRTAFELDVCTILRMKKGKMKYRAVVSGRKKQLLNAKEALYLCCEAGVEKGARHALESRNVGC